MLELLNVLPFLKMILILLHPIFGPSWDVLLNAPKKIHTSQLSYIWISQIKE